MEDGYIKFNCNWIKADPLSKTNISKINPWRDLLYGKGLIGAYSNGVGFGNISVRYGERSFLISGSATGGLAQLTTDHYALVNDYNIAQNSITCTGPVKASSESLSHAAIYECSTEINAVIHVHHLRMWERLINIFPTTRKEILYGTPEMANEIKRLFINTDVGHQKTIIMGGHKEGIFTFGKTMEEAGTLVLERLKRVDLSF